jgi:ABC-type transport system involved in multi-copper enzyme maturation permease subunit
VMLEFVALLYYKVFYDGKESSLTDITSAMAIRSALQVLPGMALIFMEIAVMAAISVAISTRLPMQVNMVTCLAIFVIGHLTPNLVYAGVFKLELVQFMARLIATVLPALEVFNIQPAIATGQEVPWMYLVWAAVYSLAYIAIGILLAFIMFEDRDLA